MTTNVHLSVHPEELHITTLLGADQDDAANTTLQLSNVSYKSVMYRLKTTAPKRYMVKPSKGVIRSNGTETIHITVNGAPDSSVKDEFRLEYAAVEDEDNVGSKYENVADILASKSSKSGKYKKDISCVVHVQDKKNASPQSSGVAMKPRAPLSPHTPPSSNVSTAASPEIKSAAVVATAASIAVPFGAQPVAQAPEFGTTETPIGRPVARPDEPLQRSPVPASKSVPPPQDAAKKPAAAQLVAQQQEQPIWTSWSFFIAVLALAVGLLWTQR